MPSRDHSLLHGLYSLITNAGAWDGGWGLVKINGCIFGNGFSDYQTSNSLLTLAKHRNQQAGLGGLKQSLIKLDPNHCDPCNLAILKQRWWSHMHPPNWALTNTPCLGPSK